MRVQQSDRLSQAVERFKKNRYSMPMYTDRKTERALARREKKARLIQKLSQLYHEDTIFIRLHSGKELYNLFDPSPLQERELSGDIESYIFKELSYKSPKARIALTFLADDISLYDGEIMRRACANHFTRRAQEQILQNRKSLRRWLYRLAVGIVVLAAFLVLAHFCRLYADGHPFFSILSESFGIIGWVALWEPATYFLYGHQDERRMLFNLMRLRHATVTIKSMESS